MYQIRNESDFRFYFVQSYLSKYTHSTNLGIENIPIMIYDVNTCYNSLVLGAPVMIIIIVMIIHVAIEN